MTSWRNIETAQDQRRLLIRLVDMQATFVISTELMHTLRGSHQRKEKLKKRAAWETVYHFLCALAGILIACCNRCKNWIRRKKSNKLCRSIYSVHV